MLRVLTLLFCLLSSSQLAIAESPAPKPSPSEAKTARTEGLLNKLLAPGPLMMGHRELEHADCLKCHAPRKGVPDSRCIDCHKELKPFVEKKTGFHGLTSKSCVQCHSDHKGRDYDSTVVDEKTFDHTLTGYNLEGKHAEIKCAECHFEKRAKAKKATRPQDIRYFGLKSTCIACHKKHDVHFYTGKFAKQDCGTCHGLKKWDLNVKFDHEKDAKYKLEGKHSELKCAKCHVPKKGQSIYEWKNLATAKCLSCHQDHHKNNLNPRFRGGDCTKCHTQDKWKIEKFDHSVTKYPLRGKHAAIACIDCHKQTPAIAKQGIKFFKWAGLKQDCLSCHKDYHLFGKFKSQRNPRPRDCLSCHTETKWKDIKNFDHDKDTRYPITGKHIGVACIKCHVVIPKSSPQTRIYGWVNLPTKTCELCHASPHKNTFTKELLAKKCTECHTEDDWLVFKKNGARFDHDKGTRFPLTGRHKQISCKECHRVGKRQIFKFASAEKSFCIDCHKNVHSSQFSGTFNDKACSACHTTTNFTKRLEFDHNTTRFKIDGKHKDLTCAKCHALTREVFPQSKDIKKPKYRSKFLFDNESRGYCVSCHANVHNGQFHKGFSEKACTVCHTTSAAFEKRLEFDHNETYFKLRGKHMELKCAKCHIPTRERFPKSKDVKRLRVRSKYLFPEIQGKDCNVCHKDPHRGEFGSKCSECHNERDWKLTRDFHRNFNLSGVHFSLECAECHKDGRRLGGMSENCLLCHQKDDIHNGTLPNCGDCHRQQFWENAEFKHSISNFPLRGIHRTLDCYSCHRNGVYKGTQSRCVDCHLQDAMSATSLDHTAGTPPAIQRNCNECHNQFSFR